MAALTQPNPDAGVEDRLQVAASARDENSR